MPDTIVPAPGHMATVNMHVGAQLPTCEWARKVAHGQGNILGNYSQMIFTSDDGFETNYAEAEWKELANHKFVLPHLATHFALSVAARIESFFEQSMFVDPLLRWYLSANLKHNATAETFWVGTVKIYGSWDDVSAGTRIRFLFNALEAGILTSGYMDDLWRWQIYLRPPSFPSTGDYASMRTWAHAFYGAYLPLK